MKKTFMELLKNSKKKADDYPERILAIIADNSTQHLATALRGYAYEEKINLHIVDTGYDQINAQVMSPVSELYTSQADSVLIFMCTEKLYEQYCLSSAKTSFADEVLESIERYWEYIEQNSSMSILQFNYIEEDDRIYGNHGLQTEESFIYQVIKLNYNLQVAAGRRKNVFLINLNYLNLRYGKELVFDPDFYYSAKMSLAMNFLPYVAKEVVGILKSQMGRVKKCIILDLDNTLWGGVVGDVGIHKIEIGDLGAGKAFTEFQRWLKQLKERGILLAVCSKNNEETAKAVFENNSDMLLKLDDFAVFVANWEDKVSNIRYIKEVLNIGFDSMIFIDDNSFERQLVKSMLPDVTVPDLPEDPAYYVSYLKDENYFETIGVSSEDKARTYQYQTEVKRQQAKSQFQTYEEYLQHLHMECIIHAFDEQNYARISQLTQRSNQFNMRTVRLTEADIENMALDQRYITLYFTLQDRFGEHGLISVVILEKRNDEEVFIHTLIMSCRVLKRTMEQFVMNKIVETAEKAGFSKLTGEYIPTSKNGMVANLYADMGFVKEKEGCYSISVRDYTKQQTYIIQKDGKEES